MLVEFKVSINRSKRGIKTRSMNKIIRKLKKSTVYGVCFVLIITMVLPMTLFCGCNQQRKKQEQNEVDAEKNAQSLLMAKREAIKSQTITSLMNDLKNESGFTDLSSDDKLQSRQFMILLFKEFKEFELIGISLNDKKIWWIAVLDKLTYNGREVFKYQYYDDGNKNGVYLAFSEDEVLQEGGIIPENGVLLVENHLYDYTVENGINIFDKK